VFLDASETAQMSQRARASRCTMFTLMLDAAAVTLAEHAATDDVIIGVPFHGRTRRQLHPMIGLVGNPLPVVLTNISRRGSDRDRLDYVKSVVAAGLRYPNVPWRLLTQEFYGLADPDPLAFLLNVQAPPDIAYGLAGIEMTEIDVKEPSLGSSFNDFELYLWRTSDQITGHLVYDADSYSQSRADALWTGIKSRLLKPAS